MGRRLGIRRRWDEAGQVSFAVVAVVLLAASAVTGAFFAKRELDQAAEDRRSRLLDAMEKAIGDVVRELSLLGAAKANVLVSQWSEFPVNETRISRAFNDMMLSRLNSSFPRTDDRFTVDVENWSGGLFFIERTTVDLVPSSAQSVQALAVDGDEMEYSQLPPASVEDIQECVATPYYLAVGNFSARVTSGEVTVCRQCSFDRPIISALPFLESKLRAFESSTEGEFSDLGSMVGYMLTTVCELRVLEGYGQPMYSGMNTSSILTEQDVYNAVAVGLLLEQARLFRDIDEDFASQVGAACGGSGIGLMALLAQEPRRLDPAELFLWFLGKAEPELDPRFIVAQAVSGLLDQLVIKLMDYMGMLGYLDLAKSVLDYMVGSLESLISFVTGEDKACDAVVSWIERALQTADVMPEAYSSAFSSSEDFQIPVPERQYFVEDASGNLYPVWVGNVSVPVDVPTLNLLESERWREFYPTFKEGQTSFRALLTDSVTRFAFDIASTARLQLEDVVFDPADDEGVFETLAERVGDVDLLLDPGTVLEAGRSLPMFSAQYDLACHLIEFVSTAGLGLVEVDGIEETLYDHVTDSIVSTVRYPYIPDLVVPVEQQIEEVVRSDVECDLSWGVGQCASGVFRELAGLYLGRLADLVASSVTKLDDGFAGPAVDGICSLLLWGADDFPGIERTIEQQLSAFAREVVAQKALRGFKDAVRVDLSGQFEFWEGDRASGVNESVSVSADPLPPLQVVEYDETVGYESLVSMFPSGTLLVQIKTPWDFDRADEGYPNTHRTSLWNGTPTPYSTEWVVNVLGMLDLEVASDNDALESYSTGGAATSHRAVNIELSLPIVVHSAWPLLGVEYNPTSTALGDALALASHFCGKVWEELEPYLGWLVDFFERVWRFITDAFEVFAKFASRVMKAVASAFQTVVETLQEYVQKIANSALARAVKAFIDIYGRVEFRASVHGFLIVVQTNLPDLIYRHGDDLLRLIVSTERFGPELAFGVRIARFTDGSYDIVANGTLAMKKAKVEVLIDPLMMVQRRFAELHCKGSGWAIDLTVPEVEPYDSIQVSTSDIPGVGALLSNIPIPVLGLSASVEAGMQLKYSPPFPTDIVVNEFESNPEGSDSGKEWVELYNPMDKPRSLDGWTIETMHGKNSTLPLAGTIGPNGLAVFEFPETSIDNGDPEDPFNDGDAIVLLDPSGATVDITPVLRDTGNDDRTNQRNWDGGPRWVFKTGSKGSSNGVPVLLASADFIAKSLFQAFKDAFAETQLEEVSPSLDFIVLFAKRVLSHFIENLLSLVKEVIHEIVFYLEVGLSDATGTAGVGFRSSFLISGEAIVDLLRWLIRSVATFIVNLGRPSNPIAFPAFPVEFLSGLYISFEVLFQVGLPKMVRLLGAVGALEGRFALVAGIAPNVPALGRLVGRDWGQWRIDFGMYIEGVPRDFVVGFLAKDTGKLVDLWIAKGTAYGT